MDFNNLPGSGARFHAGDFASHLDAATKYSSLRGNKDSILKVIKGSVGAIRSGQFSGREAFHKMQSLEKGLNYEQKRDAQKIFKSLEAKYGAAAAAKNTASMSGRLSESGRQIAAAKVKINPYLMARSSDAVAGPSGLSGNLRVDRGEAVRNKMNVEKAKNLGSGEAAREIQIKMNENLHKSS